MPDLRLAGCKSRPLVGYLKALGLLRIVSLQADPAARGRWLGETFELRSELDEDQLLDFLLSSYEPAPVISPWNGGSGFHPKDRHDALLGLEESDDPRFVQYNEAIGCAREALRRLGLDDKPSGEEKLALVRELRRTLPDAALPWLDAAVVVTGGAVAYPRLLGSGGNDGRYDFSNNYAQAVLDCLVPKKPAAALELAVAALDGTPTALKPKLSLAHFFRDASPTNSPAGESDSLANPWDLVLAIEGTLLLVAGASRRYGVGTGSTLVAPFTARATSAGYGSALAGESGRDELWLPLWSRWASRGEIATLARESRAQVRSGSSYRQAGSGLDFARAAGELGVARGIDAFERYAILERAGQSSLAVPAGRVSVVTRPPAAALQAIDVWIGRLMRFGRSDKCSTAAQRAIRRLEHATFDLALRGSSPAAQNVLEALGAAEHTLARSPAAHENGLRPLAQVPGAPWIISADDRSPEFRVALAIGSLRDHRPGLPALRDYLHGTRPSERGRSSDFDEDRRHAIDGAAAADVLARIHARRHLDAAAETDGGTDRSFGFDTGIWCELRTARSFAVGTLDDERILRLLAGLAVLDHRNASTVVDVVPAGTVAQPLYDLLALAWMAGIADVARRPDAPLGPLPGWAARLASGATPMVVREAILRLRLAGIPPIARAQDLSASRIPGDRLGAALLARIRPSDIRGLSRRLTSDEGSSPNRHSIEEDQ